MLQLFLHNRIVNEILLMYKYKIIMYKITQINIYKYDLTKCVRI